jgi:hypothetical protein
MSAYPGNQPISTSSAAELEYTALREEVLKRIESRQQMISITLTIAGAFLGIGWGSEAVVLMIYPALAVLLAAGWGQNEVRIRQLNAYIRDHLEGSIPGLGWERYNRQQERELKILGWPVDLLSVGGIYLLTQVLALALGLFHFHGLLVEWLLVLVDIISLAAVGVLLGYVREQSER